MAKNECFLVTGALGCLGAWTVARLVREGTPVVAFDAQTDPRRLALLLSDAERARVVHVQGDVAEAAQLDALIDQHGVTHIVHLAAMLHPQFRADPPRGVRVNALGGVNLFQAAARRPRQIARIVYASSIAVYDADAGAGQPVQHQQIGRPDTLYGVFKQAEEGMARVFLQDAGVSSIGIRPAFVYGAGRDQGLTADLTLAIQAAATGTPFRIGYQGRSHLHYADDLARVFLASARCDFRGAGVFNVRGVSADMPEIVAEIEASTGCVPGSIAFAGDAMALPLDYDDSALHSVIGQVPRTGLRAAIDETQGIFRGRRPALEP